jgi:uncharacterized membrane protein SirB2
MYLLVKTIHICTAVISISGFTLRGLLLLNNSPLMQQKWIRVVPHINDTVLLSCAIYLAAVSSQYPFQSDWLTAKLLALFVYIGLGMMAFRFAKTRNGQITAFLLAILSFAYIVSVALTRQPMPFL